MDRRAPADQIAAALGRHYSQKFDLHGPNSQGVDWGADESRMFLRYSKMLDLLRPSHSAIPSLLDVGCGYGGLQTFAAERNIDLDYTGIDVAENMIRWAGENVPAGKFIHGDVMSHPLPTGFDYVVCNGILTQKLDIPGLEMDAFAGALIRRLFALANVGVAFNVMTTKVNHFANNLYYRNPAELFAWCLSEITPHIRIDHSYPLYEYTVYLYRQETSR